jgi:hypothetical protein
MKKTFPIANRYRSKKSSFNNTNFTFLCPFSFVIYQVDVECEMGWKLNKLLFLFGGKFSVYITLTFECIFLSSSKSFGYTIIERFSIFSTDSSTRTQTVSLKINWENKLNVFLSFFSHLTGRAIELLFAAWRM